MTPLRPADRRVTSGGFGARFLSSRLIQNTAALYAVHLSGLILPLVTFPYLARVLRPDGWGLVLFHQAFAMWLALAVDFGFNLSGTRAVAALRDDPERSGRLVSAVLGAKTLLMLAAFVCATVAYFIVPAFHQNPHYLVAAYLYGIAIGFSPIWYFQGIERVKSAALVDVALKAAATLAIFLLVRQPSDGWIVLASYAAGALLWTVIGTTWIYKQLPFFWPRRAEVIDTLRQSSSLFAFRGVSGIYSQAAPMVLGTIAGATVVAYFAGAERLVRAATGLIQPVSQALYPRFSYLFSRNRDASVRLLRASVITISGLGLVVGVGTYVVAPYFVPLLLGPGYEEAVHVLRILSIVPPVVALATVLGIQWALPAGHDRYLLWFVVVAAVVNLAAAVVLVPSFGAAGMAGAVILAEASVLTGLMWLARREGLAWWPDFRGDFWPGVGAAVDRDSMVQEPLPQSLK